MPLKLSAIFLIFISAAAGIAQKTEPVLATAAGMSFTVSDLSGEGRNLYDQRQTLIARQRTRFFNEWVFDILLETEAKSRGTTSEKLQSDEMAKIAPPTEAQIKAVYDANRQTIGSRTMEEVRSQIVEYLKRELETKQLDSLTDILKAKHKFALGRDVNAPSLKPTEIIGTVGARTLTAGDFEARFKLPLHNLQAGIYSQIRSDFEAAVFAKLIEAEARKRNIDATAVMAAEITNKLKDHSDYERMFLVDGLQSRLFEQYDVKFTLEAPQAMVLNVSSDDDPSLGDPAAKVTVVAFVDFQCSACAAFGPLLKQVVNEFGGNVRLVVRDYPLTTIHADAMNAALAGYAARQQGKFFEMTDLMYRNQDALDTDSLKKYAQQLGLNIEQFERDRRSAAAAEEVSKDITDGRNYGVNGTPTVFVNGIQLHRLTTYAAREAIKNALKK
jgi:protein-disulfide isomerase